MAQSLFLFQENWFWLHLYRTKHQAPRSLPSFLLNLGRLATFPRGVDSVPSYPNKCWLCSQRPDQAAIVEGCPKQCFVPFILELLHHLISFLMSRICLQI